MRGRLTRLDRKNSHAPVRNEPNPAAARRTTSAFWQEIYGAFGLEETMEKRSQFAGGPFASPGGLASFGTIGRAGLGHCLPGGLRHHESGFAFDVQRRRSL
jgi:hypothetical protein